MNTITLTFTLNTREIVQLTRDKQLYWIKRLYWPAGIVFVLVSGMGIFLGKWEGTLLFALPFVFLALIFEWLWPKLMERQLHKLPSWGLPVTFEFSESHFQQKSANSAATFQWTGITKAEELPDWVLLHLGPKMLYLSIPKRAFEAESQMAAFRALLKSKGLL